MTPRFRGGIRTATNGTGGSSKVDELRVTRGVWVVLMCVGLVAGFLAAALFKFSTVADITAMVGLATTFCGTIIGAYFGVQAGAAGKEKIEEARTDAEKRAAKSDQKARTLGSRLIQAEPSARTQVDQILAQ